MTNGNFGYIAYGGLSLAVGAQGMQMVPLHDEDHKSKVQLCMDIAESLSEAAMHSSGTAAMIVNPQYISEISLDEIYGEAGLNRVVSPVPQPSGAATAFCIQWINQSGEVQVIGADAMPFSKGN